MPSFRAVVTIDDVRAGRRPPEVMDAALAACTARGTTVEAFDVEVVAGRPRIWVRFTVADSSEADEDLEALETADAVGAAVLDVARAGRPEVWRRRGARWLRVTGR